MMRKMIWSVLLFAGVISSAASAGERPLELINSNGFTNLKVWHPTGHAKQFRGGIRRIVPGGRMGSCLELKNTKTSHCGMYSMYTVKVDVEKDVIQISLYLKGKGTIDVQFLLYDKGKFGGLYYKRDKVDSPAQWIKKSYTFTGKDFRGRIRKEMEGRFSFQYLSPGSLLVDDLSCVVNRK